MIKQIDLSEWTDTKISQEWASEFVFYLHEAVLGKRLLDDDTHAASCSKLIQYDNELRKRGYEAPDIYTRAFCERRCLVDDTMQRLMIRFLGRHKIVEFCEGDTW